MDSYELENNGYKLYWQDEFDGPEPDRSSWNVEEHPSGSCDEEEQAYVDDGRHVFISDGKLVIKPERVFSKEKTVEYLSSRINTSGKHDFRYGYFEIRAKVAKGKGFQSMVRLVSTENPYGKWPMSGSIDFISVDGQYPERGTSIIHYGNPPDERSTNFGDGVTDLSDDYHVYGFEWLPGKMTFYLDGKEYFTNSYWRSCDEEGNVIAYPAPFNREFHLVINVSVGGPWVGAPDRSTVFDEDAEFRIDYIRYYRKEQYDEDVTLPEDVKCFKDPDSTGNYISHDKSDWNFEIACAGEASMETDGNEFDIRIVYPGDRDYSIQLDQDGLPLIKNKHYRLSFEAKSQETRTFKTAVTGPDIHWLRYLPDTVIEVGQNWQRHIISFEMNEEDDDNARLEFNLGRCESTASVSIRDIRLEVVPEKPSGRRTIGICGTWEDAENLNLFIEAFMNPRVRKDYVVIGFTFGLTEDGVTELKVGKQFTKFIARFDLSAIVVFAEMIKTPEVLDELCEIGRRKGIPVVFLERQHKGVINAVLNYADGFEKVVSHVLDHHGAKKVKFFAGFRDNPYSIERENIFRRLMLAHHLEVKKEDILYGDFWDATTVRVLNEKLDNGMELPDAFVCANDSMAVGVCDCLKSRGIRVPEDVLVTGFDGIWHGRYHAPSISTAAPDYHNLCSFILDIIEGKEPWENGRTIKKHIDYIERVGSSCGCCKDVPEDLEVVVNTLAENNQDYFRHILEMGKFVTRTSSMNDVDAAAAFLQHYLWLWKDQYYFVGLTDRDRDDYVHSILHGVNSDDFIFKEKFYRMKAPIPEYEDLLDVNSGVNLLLFRQLRTLDAEYGYLCSGLKELTLRKQQRFEELGLYFSAMVSSVLDKTKLLEANRAISRLNEHDYLTNLYNRRGFFRHVNSMLSDPKNKGRVFSLFSVDMDGLKYINDNFGHQEGDNAIIILAKAMLSYASDKGICARYGGDEFAMALIGDSYIADDYKDIRSKIHGYAMADPVVIELEYSINASIGIAECVVSDDVDLEALIKKADLRMYEDKQARKGSNEIR